MTNTAANMRVPILRVLLGIVAALACTLTTGCTTSDGDAESPGTSEDRAVTVPATSARPPLSIDAAAPDDTVPQLPITLTVDGETFTVTERDGGHDYTWTTGPNPGYGFSEGAPMTARVSADEATQFRPRPPLTLNTLGHYRTSIRDFLDMIDPSTGYLQE